MKLEDLDFEINSDLIALRPKKPRDESKLLISEDPLKIIKFKKFTLFEDGIDKVVNWSKNY